MTANFVALMEGPARLEPKMLKFSSFSRIFAHFRAQSSCIESEKGHFRTSSWSNQSHPSHTTLFLTPGPIHIDNVDPFGSEKCSFWEPTRFSGTGGVKLAGNLLITGFSARIWPAPPQPGSTSHGRGDPPTSGTEIEMKSAPAISQSLTNEILATKVRELEKTTPLYMHSSCKMASDACKSSPKDLIKVEHTSLPPMLDTLEEIEELPQVGGLREAPQKLRNHMLPQVHPSLSTPESQPIVSLHPPPYLH